MILPQECIPGGCVPPAAVAIRGDLHTPPPPGSGTLPDQNPHQLPPWVLAWKPARHAGIAPPPRQRAVIICFSFEVKIW